jgi:16S rRNA (uracil1498-N3)-methyltransferase
MNLIILLDEDFISENKVKFSGRRLEHILNIHKAIVGDKLKVGRLNGLVGCGTVVEMNSEYIVMEIILSENPPLPLDIQVVMAMPRPKVFRRMIQDMTTVGVKKVFVIKTWKVEKSFWESPVLSEEKLKESMILGLEQAKDTVLPEIQIFKRFKPFVEDELPGIIRGTDCILGHPKGRHECKRESSREITLAIGPEGGFTPYEVDMFVSSGFKVFSLGERILRVETVLPYIIGKLS